MMAFTLPKSERQEQEIWGEKGSSGLPDLERESRKPRHHSDPFRVGYSFRVTALCPTLCFPQPFPGVLG